MKLTSFMIKNFRKYSSKKNEFLFAYEKIRKNSKKENEFVDISKTSTLIVGKNNVGKTSVLDALNKLIGKNKFVATDFNFHYLLDFYKEYKKSDDKGKIKLPKIEFAMKFELDDKDDIVSIISPVLLLNNTNEAFLKIEVLIREDELFREELDELIAEQHNRNIIIINRLIKIIDKAKLKLKYLSQDDQEIKDFKLGDLIEIHSIDANKLSDNRSLSKAFNKIIKYRYRNRGEILSDIDSTIEEINIDLTEIFVKDHQNQVNESLEKIEHPSKLEISLSSNLTHEKILSSDILLYQYKENGLTIPEDQYGLGYSNLVMIIAKIIEYIEEAPQVAFTSKINLITIEEPETYMHPQMQELFIKNINEAIRQLLNSREKYANSQLIITTHSPHILSSKIHSGNSFDYINYLTEVDRKLNVVSLADSKIVDNNLYDKKDEMIKRLTFLKKHIKFEVSNLFYADAAIFVEGITEKILIKNYIDFFYEKLRKYYITIFNIGGAHGLVYHKLISMLKIPTLIITDLDIKIEDDKKNEKSNMENISNKKEIEEKKFIQVKNIKGKKTTNKTLQHYFGENLKGVIYKKEIRSKPKNLFITFQEKKEGIYATSFEEALILANYKNDSFKRAFRRTKPEIYEKYKKKFKERSRLLQYKLRNDKSEFANNLLLEMIETNGFPNHIQMPNYIVKGLDWLKRQLEGEGQDE